MLNLWRSKSRTISPKVPLYANSCDNLVNWPLLLITRSIDWTSFHWSSFQLKPFPSPLVVLDVPGDENSSASEAIINNNTTYLMQIKLNVMHLSCRNITIWKRAYSNLPCSSLKQVKAELRFQNWRNMIWNQIPFFCCMS